MAAKDKKAFQNIEYKNVANSSPLPDKIKDIDTHNNIYANIIEAQEKGTLDVASINSFTSISNSRDQIYGLLDMMGEDPIISSALEIYAADATEPNEQGKVMWVAANDEEIAGSVTQILDSFNVDKNAFSQVYSLCKYGDLYLKLYRRSEFDDKKLMNEIKTLNESLNNDTLTDEEKTKLKEDLILKIYSKNDRYADYAEQVKNPAEVFDLVKFGKTCMYIKTHILSQNNSETTNSIVPTFNNTLFNYKLNFQDIDIFGATEFVHACLEDNSDRVAEEVTLFRPEIEQYKTNNYNSDVDLHTKYSDSANLKSFSVKRGKSILYDSFKIWRELSLLENSVLLNRLTKSSILRTINVEVGDMGKTEVQTLLRRIKVMVEQKTAYNVNSSMQDYVNPGPMENILYFPTHDGKGAVSTAQIGGDVEVGDLNDLDYWKKKLFASLGIPGQFLGDTDDATGFNGGTSLSLISSRYAKTIKRIQNAYIQMYTDAVNLILLDRGQQNFINKFTLHMQAPATQEERDRRENLSNSINSIREIMGLLDDIDDKQTKLEILKSLLAGAITNQEVIGFIQDEIDKINSESTEEESNESTFDSEEMDFDFSETDLDNAVDFDTEIESESESEPIETSEPEESFYSGTGKPLNETNDLPNFNQLGISFTDVR